jgi:hypothetical protein
MKAKLTLVACAFLLMSNGAGAQAPVADTQKQEAPSAKMTGEEMMSHMGQCGPRMMRHGMKHQAMHMRVMMILMDTDGDGALSLEEVQAAHAKIFKSIDSDKDGKVTPTEVQMFFRGFPTSDR